MAMSAASSSYLAVAVPCGSFRSGRCGLPSTVSLPHPRLGRAMRVRCQAEEKPQEEPAIVSPPPQPAQQVQTPPTNLPTKESTKFSDVLAFSGPAPERINGRLAMLGFASAIGVELANGNDIFEQLRNGGLPWFACAAVLFSAASLVPLFSGVSAQSKSSGLMTANAEIWNGRFAMIGLVALAFTEYLKGGPLV